MKRFLSKNISKRKELLNKLLSQSFSTALQTVLEEYDLNKEIIEDEFNISFRTIERYYYGETLPEKITLIQILIEIGCYFEVSQFILTKAGYILTSEETPYIIFLEQEGKLSIRDCNEILKAYNKSLGPNEKKLPLFKERKKNNTRL